MIYFVFRIKRLEAFDHICADKTASPYQKHNFTSESIYDVIEGMAISLDDNVHKCWFHGKQIDCTKHLVPIFTEGGLCFTFNALNSHDIYSDK